MSEEGHDLIGARLTRGGIEHLIARLQGSGLSVRGSLTTGASGMAWHRVRLKG